MKRHLYPLAVLIGCCLAPGAHAAMAVVDAGAISRLAAQLRTAEQQLSTTREALREAQAAYTAMTGSRGLERLLANTNRNYLPENWNELTAALANAQGAYHALYRDLQRAIESNLVLSEDQLASFAGSDQQLQALERRTVALKQVLARQALGETSRRFSSLQQLIDAIAVARDPKAIGELNARIAAEQAMLANEAAKLTTLYQSAEAERAAVELRLKERAIADIGSLRDLPPMDLE